jgi:hypothetical protein
VRLVAREAVVAEGVERVARRLVGAYPMRVTRRVPTAPGSPQTHTRVLSSRMPPPIPSAFSGTPSSSCRTLAVRMSRHPCGRFDGSGVVEVAGPIGNGASVIAGVGAAGDAGADALVPTVSGVPAQAVSARAASSADPEGGESA